MFNKLLFFCLFAFFSSCIFVTGYAIGQSVQYQAVTPMDVFKTPPQIDEDDLLSAVNTWRSESNFTAYKKSDILCGYATRRVKEIQVNWSHDGFENMPRIDSFQILGENLSKDFYTSNKTLNSWLNSPSHKKNLTENFTYTCIRCENNHCVQIFAK